MVDEVNPASQGAVSVPDAVQSLLTEHPQAEQTVRDEARQLLENEEKPAAEKPSGEQPQEAAEEPQDVLQEEAEPEEETTEEDEPLEAINPPASWKQADKERFAELPRDIQQVIADRESSREKATNRALQEAAEKRKAAEAELQAVTSERQHYQQQLESILPALQNSVAREFSDIKTPDDVQRLAEEEPDRFAKWQASQYALQMAQAEHNKVLEQHRQEQAKAQKEYLAKAEERLVEAFPEWKDTEKGRREISEMHNYLMDEYNVPRDVLPAMVEPYHYQLVKKAMLYDRAQKAKAKAVTKNVPKVQKPGSPASKKEQAADERAARLSRLDRAQDPVRGDDLREIAVGLIME